MELSGFVQSLVTAKVDVHKSVNRDITTKTTNKIQPCRLICYSLSALHVLGDFFAHNQEHLTVFTASGSIYQCRWCRGRVGKRPRNQPAATLVNITRCCKYSQVLLIMDESIARNM